jgi:hypothetical protein
MPAIPALGRRGGKEREEKRKGERGMEIIEFRIARFFFKHRLKTTTM